MILDDGTNEVDRQKVAIVTGNSSRICNYTCGHYPSIITSMLKCSASGSYLLVSELCARTTFGLARYCYIYHVAYILLIILPETAASPSSLTRNRPGPNKQQQYRCNICDKPFDSAETLDSHQKFEHSEPAIANPLRE